MSKSGVAMVVSPDRLSGLAALLDGISYKGPDPQGVWPKCDRCGRMSRYVYLNPNDQGHECFGCVALKVAVVGRE